MTAAEVRLSSDGRALEIVPRGAQRDQLEEQLRDQVPPVLTRRIGRRLRLDFAAGRQLTTADGIDMTWSPEAEQAMLNRHRVQELAPSVLAEAKRIRDGGISAAREALADVPQAVARLDDHQIVNVAVMTIPDGWGACIFDEQGTGKTVTVISAFDVLVERNQADVLLVVAPKSMVAEWATEFQRFTGDLYKVSVAQGNRREKAEALHVGADVVVTNYEGAVTLRDDLRLLTGRCRVVLAVDESYNVKNPDAARTAALAELREWCASCFVLCGTPAPHGSRDLVSQFDLVDFGLTFDDIPLNEDSPAQREAIRGAMESRGLYTRNLKAAVLPDLPPRRYSEIELEMAPEQHKLYSSALDNLVEDLQATSDAHFRREFASFLARRNALLRICSNPASITTDYEEIPSKLLALDEMLPRYVNEGEKLVLWSFYRTSLDALADRYAHLGLVRVDGSVSDVAERRDAVRRFQKDDDVSIFLGNPAAAGAGLTLHSARIGIYESLSNQAAHFMQSLDRIHRRGQGRSVEYVVLLCRDTLEQSEYQRLLDKTDAQADVLGDPVPRRPTRQLVLDELLNAQRMLRHEP